MLWLPAADVRADLNATAVAMSGLSLRRNIFCSKVIYESD